jgi:hypothetical protein
LPIGIEVKTKEGSNEKGCKYGKVVHIKPFQR